MTEHQQLDSDDGRKAANGAATVTQIAAYRRTEDVLTSITFVFGGVHYGTIAVSAPYTKGKPIVLYIVPQQSGGDNAGLSGPVDCLLTDEVALAADLGVAR